MIYLTKIYYLVAYLVIYYSAQCTVPQLLFQKQTKPIQNSCLYCSRVQLTALNSGEFESGHSYCGSLC